jgi:hypothetical protein
VCVYRPVNVFAYVHAFVFVCMCCRFFPLYGHFLIPDPHVCMPTLAQTYMHTCIHTYMRCRFCGRHGPRTILELLAKRGYKIDMFSQFGEQEKEVCSMQPEAMISVVCLSLFFSLSLSLSLSVLFFLSAFLPVCACDRFNMQAKHCFSGLCSWTVYVFVCLDCPCFRLLV